MIEKKLPELAEVSFTFRDRGTVIPADRRPAWRMAIVVLLLKYCSRGQKSSLVRLHTLDWALRSMEGRRQLLAFLDGEVAIRYVCVRYDPALLRAVLLGEAEELIRVEGKSVRLISFGEKFVNDLEKSKNILVNEVEFMKILGKRFTETKTEQFLKAGGTK